jgi:hypothetical protein
MSAWTDFATKHYNANKHKSGYTYGDALKEAAKLYKKGVSVVSSSTKKMRKTKSKKRVGGKSRKGGRKH